MKTHMVSGGEWGRTDLCTRKASGSYFTREWEKVTCNLCLKMKKKRGERGENEWAIKYKKEVEK